MSVELRSPVTRVEVLTFISLAVAATASSAAAQSRPNRGEVVRQFRMNFSSDKLDKNGEMVADDIVVEVNGGVGSKPNGATYRGRDAFVAWQKGVKAIFPGSKITEDDIVVSGNKVAVRYTVSGPHRGPLPTPNGVIQPTGRTVHIHAAEFFTFNDEGKVAKLQNFSNDLNLVHQLTAK